MHGHRQSFKAKSTLCPRLLIKRFVLNRTSADNNSGLVHPPPGRQAARLASDLINPLILPPLVMAFTSWLVGLSGFVISSATGLAFLFYSIVPLAASFYLLKKKQISSLDLPRRKKRTPLFIYSIISALLASLCFAATEELTHPLLPMISIVFLANLVISSLVNLRWKMSIHTATLASSGAILLAFSFLFPSFGLVLSISARILPLLILLLLLPLVIWARRCLGVHSIPELLGGAAAGFVLTMIELPLLNNLWYYYV